MVYNLIEYVEAVKSFANDTKDWYALSDYKFYTNKRHEWVESSDNECGGLDVSWAFHKEPNFDTIREKFVELVTQDITELVIGNDTKSVEITLKNLD